MKDYIGLKRSLQHVIKSQQLYFNFSLFESHFDMQIIIIIIQLCEVNCFEAALNLVQLIRFLILFLHIKRLNVNLRIRLFITDIA